MFYVPICTMWAEEGLVGIHHEVVSHIEKDCGDDHFKPKIGIVGVKSLCKSCDLYVDWWRNPCSLGNH